MNSDIEYLKTEIQELKKRIDELEKDKKVLIGQRKFQGCGRCGAPMFESCYNYCDRNK